MWELKNDTISCKTDLPRYENISPTKRNLLSLAQSVNDPIGFTCPFTLIPKLILQETWSLKLKWNEKLPGDLVKRFVNWVKKSLLTKIEILPRWVKLEQGPDEIPSLHVFCDASKLSYACCVFLRVQIENNVCVRLIQARSRVALLKPLTIPRLELLSYDIGAR